MQVYLNGSFLDHTEAKVSVVDRGFIFGDGVYEVTRVINGEPFREKEHLARLDKGLKALKINLETEVRESIPDIHREIIKRNDLLEGEASIYLQITRGAAWPRTHTFPEQPIKSTIFLSAASFEPHTELHKTGVDVITLSDIRWTRCNIKTVLLLPNTLAKQQAHEAGVNSALLIRDGVVTESPNANIFAVKDGALYTYPESNYILSGITRSVVLEIAEKLEIPVHFTPVREEEIFDLDELFFSGTTTDIQPVTVINGKNLGTGKPGPVVHAIQEEYGKLLYGK
ncbi:aminotransferase class IV [Rhodohalobacter sp. 614A]|uniref:aminotransferase class IV n=1 Tax=Rhodohalobacter sp. 614A TaxID=2908649 RepID=UPI001F325930|nr:aminotransferase class IV [Rhodohalobacter sp. 614A]